MDRIIGVFTRASALRVGGAERASVFFREFELKFFCYAGTSGAWPHRAEHRETRQGRVLADREV